MRSVAPLQRSSVFFDWQIKLCVFRLLSFGLYWVLSVLEFHASSENAALPHIAHARFSQTPAVLVDTGVELWLRALPLLLSVGAILFETKNLSLDQMFYGRQRNIIVADACVFSGRFVLFAFLVFGTQKDNVVTGPGCTASDNYFGLAVASFAISSVCQGALAFASAKVWTSHTNDATTRPLGVTLSAALLSGINFAGATGNLVAFMHCVLTDCKESAVQQNPLECNATDVYDCAIDDACIMNCCSQCKCSSCELATALICTVCAAWLMIMIPFFGHTTENSQRLSEEGTWRQFGPFPFVVALWTIARSPAVVASPRITALAGVSGAALLISSVAFSVNQVFDMLQVALNQAAETSPSQSNRDTVDDALRAATAHQVSRWNNHSTIENPIAHARTRTATSHRRATRTSERSLRFGVDPLCSQTPATGVVGRKKIGQHV